MKSEESSRETLDIILPSAHDVTVATEHLCETADYDVCRWKDVHVHKVADRFVNDYRKVELICKSANASQVGSLEQWIARKLAKESKELVPILAASFEIVEVS